MRDDNGVESLQVNTKLPDIVLQDAGVIAGVEEDALATVLDECGISPIFHELRGVAKCVVEHGDVTLRLRGHGQADWRKPEREQEERCNHARACGLFHDTTSDLWGAGAFSGSEA